MYGGRGRLKGAASDNLGAEIESGMDRAEDEKRRSS